MAGSEDPLKVHQVSGGVEWKCFMPVEDSKLLLSWGMAMNELGQLDKVTKYSIVKAILQEKVVELKNKLALRHEETQSQSQISGREVVTNGE